MSKKFNGYSIDYSANWIFNTTSNAKCDQTDGKNHPDYGIPFHIPENEPIVITSDAVLIKPLKLVVLTEGVYNKLKGKENEI